MATFLYRWKVDNLNCLWRLYECPASFVPFLLFSRLPPVLLVCFRLPPLSFFPPNYLIIINSHLILPSSTSFSSSSSFHSSSSIFFFFFLLLVVFSSSVVVFFFLPPPFPLSVFFLSPPPLPFFFQSFPLANIPNRFPQYDLFMLSPPSQFIKSHTDT